MKKIALIPIDNRPICYTLIEQICATDKDIELLMPEREFLGNLKKNSDIDKILAWLQNIDDIDYLILSLDTIAYGGLIPSRRSAEPFEMIMERINKLKEIIKEKKCKTYAHSSVMRISNNNVNEEEKGYWNIWGKKIFEYSYHTHKARFKRTDTCIENIIPEEILKDYLVTRKRNFDINLEYLKLAEENVFDFLVFSKDDTGKYGLNVEEAQILKEKIKKDNINATVKTGADEIPLSLISRVITDGTAIKIYPLFLSDKSTDLISKYEDISVFECVKGQIELAGAVLSNKNESDITIVVNNFDFEQGDLVLGDVVNGYLKTLELPKNPYFIADINNANGADNNFIQKLMSAKADKNFFGYCGYNTSANTIGCGICIALVKLMAKKYDDNAFKKLQFIRFTDDWAYQANIRITGVNRLNDADFLKYENAVNNFLDTNYTNIKYNLPWQRSFEVEIDV